MKQRAGEGFVVDPRHRPLVSLLARAATPWSRARAVVFRLGVAVAVEPGAGAEIEARVEDLLRKMTSAEKLSLVAGADSWHTAAVPRLGIPAIKMTDGPLGARGAGFSGATSACFPSGSALGATWDPDLVREIGVALGQEARSKGARVLLAPTINIHRHPLAGRNFECFSEDPYLSVRLAVAYVEGVQSQRVAATAKHFVCNDSEYERMTISSEVGERTLREIYLPPFEAAVREAGVWALMASYNRINGTYAAEHPALLLDLLKEEWGFDGLVMSDWWGTRSTVASANSGLDLEMPGPSRHFGGALRAAVEAGEVLETTIDDKVRRLLRLLARTGALDDPDEAAEQSIDDPAHRALIRRAARDSMVLLQNEGDVLPLDAEHNGVIAVIGPNADVLSVLGGGSARVEPHHVVSVLDALTARVGSGCDVQFEPGCRIHRRTPTFERGLRAGGVDGPAPGVVVEFFNGPECTGEPVFTHRARRMQFSWTGDFAPGVIPGPFSVRVRATFVPESSGPHRLTLTSAGLSRLLLDGAVVVDNWTAQTPGSSFYGRGSGEAGTTIDLAGTSHEIVLEFQSTTRESVQGVIAGCLPPVPADQMERAVALAARADAVVLVVGLNAEWETEGADRVSMDLPGDQNELIHRVASVNPRTVVVINTGSPVSMPWADEVAAILQAWYPGQEGGDAVADLLFGDVDPGGRLPDTFPVQVEDSPAHLTYPGEAGAVSYGEGIFTGYRGFDRRRVAPRFPFGHGMSYTSFAYGDVSVDRSSIGPGEDLIVTVAVRNGGERPGREVVQVYVRDVVSSLLRPEMELKGFAKVALQPGEETAVRIVLPHRAFAAWDPTVRGWSAEAGDFEILVGASSRDVRGHATVRLTGQADQ